MPHPYFDVPRPIVFGHRGASGERPENTLSAFERALEQGAAILETDVHRTADAQVVISHDPDVARMTEGAGRIEALTLAELRSLDAGYRFTTDGGASFPYRGHGIRIPTLAEAFEAFPQQRFNLEIKQNDPTLIHECVRLVHESGRDDTTLLAAERDETMKALRDAIEASGARPAVGAAVGDVLAFIDAAVSGHAPPPEPMALQIPPEFGGNPLVTPELVSFAHEHAVQVHVWTINDAEEMHRLLDLEVDGVMSDFPGRLREVVDARGGSH